MQKRLFEQQRFHPPKQGSKKLPQCAGSETGPAGPGPALGVRVGEGLSASPSSLPCSAVGFTFSERLYQMQEMKMKATLEG